MPSSLHYHLESITRATGTVFIVQEGLISLTYNCLTAGSTVITTHLAVVSVPLSVKGVDWYSVESHEVTFSIMKECDTAKVAQDTVSVPGLNIGTIKALTFPSDGPQKYVYQSAILLFFLIFHSDGALNGPYDVLMILRAPCIQTLSFFLFFKKTRPPRVGKIAISQGCESHIETGC